MKDRKKLINEIIDNMQHWDHQALVDWARIYMKKELEAMNDEKLEASHRVYKFFYPDKYHE